MIPLLSRHILPSPYPSDQEIAIPSEGFEEFNQVILNIPINKFIDQNLSKTKKISYRSYNEANNRLFSERISNSDWNAILDSPDLNSIENLWAYIKNKIKRVFITNERDIFEKFSSLNAIKA